MNSPSTYSQDASALAPDPSSRAPLAATSIYYDDNGDAPTEVRMKEGLLDVQEFERLNPDAIYTVPQQPQEYQPDPVSSPPAAAHLSAVSQRDEAPTEIRMKEGLLDVQEFERLNPDAVYPVPQPTSTMSNTAAVAGGAGSGGGVYAVPTIPEHPSIVTEPPPLCPSVDTRTPTMSNHPRSQYHCATSTPLAGMMPHSYANGSGYNAGTGDVAYSGVRTGFPTTTTTTMGGGSYATPPSTASMPPPASNSTYGASAIPGSGYGGAPSTFSATPTMDAYSTPTTMAMPPPRTAYSTPTTMSMPSPHVAYTSPTSYGAVPSTFPTTPTMGSYSTATVVPPPLVTVNIQGRARPPPPPPEATSKCCIIL